MNKILTSGVVLVLALELIEKNGSTTTLDIKEEARRKSYWANQNDVSAFVQELVDEKDLQVSNNGGSYRTYKKGNTDLINEANDGNAQATSSTPTSGWSYKLNSHKSDSVVVSETKHPKKDDWIVSNVTLSDVVNFPGSYSRDNVRAAYRGLFGGKIQETRAKRIK